MKPRQIIVLVILGIIGILVLNPSWYIKSVVPKNSTQNHSNFMVALDTYYNDQKLGRDFSNIDHNLVNQIIVHKGSITEYTIGDSSICFSISQNSPSAHQVPVRKCNL